MATQVVVVGIILAVVMAALVVFQDFLLNGGFTRVRTRGGFVKYEGRISASGWLQAVVFGLLIGLAYCFAPVSLETASIAMLGVVVAMVYGTWRAVNEVSRWYELLATAGIFAVVTVTGCHVAKYIEIANYGWLTLVEVLPLLLLAICGAIVLVSYFVYHYRGLHLRNPEKLDNNSKALYGLGAILSVIAAIVMIVLLLVLAWF